MTQPKPRHRVCFHPDTFKPVTLASGRVLEVRVPGDPYLEVTYTLDDGSLDVRHVALTGDAYNRALKLRPLPTRKDPA